MRQYNIDYLKVKTLYYILTVCLLINCKQTVINKVSIAKKETYNQNFGVNPNEMVTPTKIASFEDETFYYFLNWDKQKIYSYDIETNNLLNEIDISVVGEIISLGRITQAMKSLITSLILILILNSFSVKAQSYTPLVIDSTHWFTSPPPPIAPPPYEYSEYYLLGDTTVSTISYKKVYYRKEMSSSGYGNLTSAFSLAALLREDSLNKKVYGIVYNSTLNPCQLNQEILLYDFDLQVGDTLKSANLCLLLADDSVTSIAQGNWLPSNSFSLQNSGQLIEGVGSNFGLLETIFLSVSGSQHRLIDYCRGGLSNCKYLITSVVNEISENKINIFPNPTNRNISIDLGGVKHNVRATLTNNLGQIILSQQIESTDIINMDIDAPKGIYFLQLETTEREFTIIKVIKE